MQDFIMHINKPNLQFSCYRFGDRNESLDYVIKLKNKHYSHVSTHEIDVLKELIKESDQQLISFYQKYNGLKLYCNKEDFSLEFFIIHDLEKLNKEWKYWFFDYEDNELHDFQKYGIAFGRIPHSSKYFVFYEGKVYLSDHEGCSDKPIADCFYSFLSKIAADPTSFFAEIGADIRYCNHKKLQLVPKELVDCEN